jgi:ABC-type antimicrobial peptide transport system permease subunit
MSEIIDWINANILITAIIAAVILLVIIIAAVNGGKKRKAKKSGEKADSGRVLSVLAKAVSKKNINYEPIVEIARAISNNDTTTVGKMKLLARDFPTFVTQHSYWCDSVIKRVNSNAKTESDFLDKADKDALIVNFFAYWMIGFSGSSARENSPTGKFGCYVTNHDNPRNLLMAFADLDKTLKYGLDLNSISLSGISDTAQLVPVMNTAMSYKRYGLVSLETESARFKSSSDDHGYYLFIAPMNDHDKIMQNANKVDFKIYRQLGS